MNYRCRICNTSGDHPVYRIREMMLGTGDRFLYFECASCQCLQIAEIPADMGKYYPRDY